MLLLGQVQGLNCGINVYEDEYDIYDILNDTEDVVNGENQVVVESRYCPFNDLQLAEFQTQVVRLDLQTSIDARNYDMLFEFFMNALRVSMLLLSDG